MFLAPFLGCNLEKKVSHRMISTSMYIQSIFLSFEILCQFYSLSE